MGKPQHEPVFIKIVITRDVYERIAEFRDNWAGTEIQEVLVRVEVGNGQAHEIGGTLEGFLDKLGLGVAAKIIKSNER